MSAQGPTNAAGQDLLQAITALSREMADLSRAVKDSTRSASGGAAGGGPPATTPAAKGGSGFGAAALSALAGPAGAVAGFVENAAFKAGREFVTDTAMGVAGDFAKFGFGTKGVSFSDSVTSSALRAGGSIPIIGDLFEQVTQPLDAAAGRTGGITTAIARAGGKVDPEMRKALFERFNQEEVRARDETNEIDKLKKSDPVARGEAMTGTRVESAMQAAADNLGTIATALAQLLTASPGSAAATLASAAAAGGSGR